MAGYRVAVVIPALNEAASIGNVVRACAQYGMPIVVDDGSSDNTSSLAKDAGAIVVRHEGNCGYDASLSSGFLKAETLGVDFVITIDADGQHDPVLIGPCLEILESGVDVVIGIRHHRQRLAEFCFACVTKVLYGIQDPLCGFKGYRMSVYMALGHFDSYRSIGTELALFAARSGYSFAQLPVQIRKRADKPRFGQGWAANCKIFRAMLLSFIRIRPVTRLEKKS